MLHAVHIYGSKTQWQMLLNKVSSDQEVDERQSGSTRALNLILSEVSLDLKLYLPLLVAHLFIFTLHLRSPPSHWKSITYAPSQQ
jgi:hypothetical protein